MPGEWQGLTVDRRGVPDERQAVRGVEMGGTADGQTVIGDWKPEPIAKSAMSAGGPAVTVDFQLVPADWQGEKGSKIFLEKWLKWQVFSGEENPVNAIRLGS